MKHLLIAAAALLPGPALAAEEPARVDDIIVTADRQASFGAGLVQVGTFRNARLIDVPLTVNVVPRELLEAQAATGLFDALRNTAGVSRSQLSGAAYDNIAVRGILVENRTSYRLNGTLPVINLVDLPLENKARVEVLKGVGALYYGFAPPSGIINLVTKRPDTDLTAIELRGNLHGGFGGALDVSRVFGRIGVRVNAGADDVDPGIDRFGGRRHVVAAAIDWRATDALTLRADIEHVAKDVTETPAVVLPAAVAGAVAVPPPPAPSTNLGDRWLRYDAHATNAMLRADWRLAPYAVLTVEGGQALTVRDRDYSQLGALNLQTGEGVLQLFQTRDQRYRNRNLRAELALAAETGAFEHQLVLGGTQNWRYQNGRGNQVSPATNIPGAITQNLFTPRAVAVVPVTQALAVSPLNVSDFGAYAFSRTDWRPDGRALAQLLLGVRRSIYRSSTRNNAGAVTARYATDAWTPSVGLVLKPTANASLYGTYLEGLEEGGTAPANNLVNPGAVLPPARSRQWEAGAKADLAGLTLQAAWFQVTRAQAGTPAPNVAFGFLGRARYRGVEFSANGELTPDISIYASGTVLDAEFVSAVNPAQVGRRPENTPKITYSAYAEWRAPFAPGLALGAGLFHVGGRAVDNLNRAFIPGYTSYSASVRYTVAGIGADGLRLQLSADNLDDARVWAAAGNGLLSQNLPRVVKFVVGTRF